MTTREDLQDALSNHNVRAFLRTIREGETDQTGRAYRKLVGDGPGVYSIKSLRDHPHRAVFVKNLGLISTAAGAYQFLGRTWDEQVKVYGFEDFTPSNQDEAAVGLIAKRGALDELMAGNLAYTLDKCSYEWASLPPGRYGQPVITEDRAYEVYKNWGGKVREDPT